MAITTLLPPSSLQPQPLVSAQAEDPGAPAAPSFTDQLEARRPDLFDSLTPFPDFKQAVKDALNILDKSAQTGLELNLFDSPVQNLRVVFSRNINFKGEPVIHIAAFIGESTVSSFDRDMPDVDRKAGINSTSMRLNISDLA